MLLVLSVAHGVLYVVFLLVSLTLFDASSRLDSRILSPLFMVGLLGAAVLAWRLHRRAGSTAPAATLIGGGLVLIALQARASIELLERSAVTGLGFSSAEWRHSQTVRAVTELDPGLALYSNQALPLYFLTGRPASAVPELTDPVKGGDREDFPELLAGMRRRLQAGEAALVLFEPQSLGPELPDLTKLIDGMQPIILAEDGAIYVAEDRTGG